MVQGDDIDAGRIERAVMRASWRFADRAALPGHRIDAVDALHPDIADMPTGSSVSAIAVLKRR